MKFLVIGGAGYIGSHFVGQAEEAGHRCLVLDNLSTGYRQALSSDVKLVEGDLLDQKLVGDLLTEYQPDAVFHFAACALVGESMSQPHKYYANNVEGVRRLLEAIRQKHPTSVLIFSSTCAVFGVPARLPIAEDDLKQPISPYGRSKLMAEYLIEDYARAYGLKGVALRYFNACGAHPNGQIGEDHQPETHLIPNVLRSVLRGESLSIFGRDMATPDGTCVRDYIHVLDLAKAHLQAAIYLTEQTPGCFEAIHLGTGEGISNLEIVEAAGRVTNRSVAYEFADPRPGDPPMLFADHKKAEQLLDFRPEFSDVDTIIRTAWEWHRHHPEGYADKS
jgi:UDP-glucose 4-epimerase